MLDPVLAILGFGSIIAAIILGVIGASFWFVPFLALFQWGYHMLTIVKTDHFQRMAAISPAGPVFFRFAGFFVYYVLFSSALFLGGRFLRWVFS